MTMTTTTLQLQPIEHLAAAAAELAQAAHNAGDTRNENAINKAMWHLHCGAVPTLTTGGFLVPSGTQAGVIYRVSHVYGCNCKAGEKQQPCHHAATIEIIEHAARRYTMPAAPDLPYADAIAELDKRFATHNAEVAATADWW